MTLSQVDIDSPHFEEEKEILAKAVQKGKAICEKDMSIMLDDLNAGSNIISQNFADNKQAKKRESRVRKYAKYLLYCGATLIVATAIGMVACMNSSFLCHIMRKYGNRMRSLRHEVRTLRNPVGRQINPKDVASSIIALTSLANQEANALSVEVKTAEGMYDKYFSILYYGYSIRLDKICIYTNYNNTNYLLTY